MRAIVRSVTATLSVFALTLALAGTAAAQDRPAPANQAPDVNYEFGDHDVDGGRYSARGDILVGRGRRSRNTLVRPRVHFVPEMLRSVERL